MWPADLSSPEGYGKHDGTVNILDIVQLTPPVFNTSPPDPNYSIRKDFNGDSVINILDIVRLGVRAGDHRHVPGAGAR